MNDRIRAVASARLEEKGMSHADLARVTGTTPQAIARVFEETGSRGGAVYQLWSDILDALDLQLTAEEKPSEGKK